MTHKHKKAICIGAGFGGMAAALRLKAKGYQVTLIDRMPRLGGRAQCYEKDGFSFDAGPTVITAPHLFEELFQLFDKKLENYVEIIPLQLWYRYLFDDGRTLDYGRDLDDTLNQIRTFHPKDVEGYKKLLKFSESNFKVGFEKLSSKPFHQFSRMLKILPEMIKLKSYRSVYSIVSSYIKNESLRKAFTISPLLVGGNPFETTSIYTLIHYLERKWGVHFPKGGTKSLVDAIGVLMKEEGVEIKLSTTVKQILVEGKKATGVLTESGESISADIVVVNGDPAFTYKNMLQGFDRRKWTNKKIDSLSYSMGLFVLYFATNKSYNDIAHHTIIFGEAYKTLLDEIFNGHKLSLDLSLYLHRPAATDPSMAPNGSDCFYALAPVPHLKGNIDWEKTGPIIQDRILEILEKKALPGLKSHLATAFHVTPETFKSDYLSEWGAGFSIAPIFKQSAYFRFHNKSEEVQSLYFVGAGTHPGAGLPGVLSSAKVLDEIAEEQGAL